MFSKATLFGAAVVVGVSIFEAVYRPPRRLVIPAGAGGSVYMNGSGTITHTDGEITVEDVTRTRLQFVGDVISNMFNIACRLTYISVDVVVTE